MSHTAHHTPASRASLSSSRRSRVASRSSKRKHARPGLHWSSKLEKLTNDLRIAEAKRGGADFIVEFEEVALSKLFRNFEIQMGRPAYLMVEEAGPPGMRPAKTFRPSYYLESDDGKAEVTVVCKQYLDHVEKLVQDFLTAQQ